MRVFRFPLIALLLLCGCQAASDTMDSWFPRPPMDPPRGIYAIIPKEQTPELDARAARERETLPTVPQAADPETYTNLGTVPPKPVMPTEAEIATQVGSLAAEQKEGAATIAAQANADMPVTIPKPGRTTPSTTPPARPVSLSAVPIVQPSQFPPLSGAEPLEGEEAQVFTRDNQVFLPQSQIEQTDRAAGRQ